MPDFQDPKTRGAGAGSKSPPEEVKGKTWFFGIGINAYQSFQPLNNAAKDVRDIQELLLEKYDLEKEQSKLLLDEEATRVNIIDQLDQLTAKIPEEDRLIIYYSGHGHLNSITELGYWIPCDAQKGKSAYYINNSTIRDYIKAIDARHILLISDSCFSGSLFVRGTGRSGGRVADELDAIPSRWALCSGRHDEEVYDGEPGQNSPFAESILDTLRANQHQALNIAKLADRVVEQTRSNYRQLPEGNPLFGVGHKGGQFIFRLKRKKVEKLVPQKTEEKKDPEKIIHQTDQKQTTRTVEETTQTVPAKQGKSFAGWIIPVVLVLILSVWGIRKMAYTRKQPAKVELTAPQLQRKFQQLDVKITKLKLDIQNDVVSISGIVRTPQEKKKVITYLKSQVGSARIIERLHVAEPNSTQKNVPKVDYRFRGDDLVVTISEGTAPYILTVVRDEKGRYRHEFETAGTQSFSIKQFRDRPGEYSLQVRDKNGKITTSKITIGSK